VPAFFSCTVSPTTSTMFSLLLTSAATPPAVFLDLRLSAPPASTLPTSGNTTRFPYVLSHPTRDLPNMTRGLSSLDKPSERNCTPSYPLLTRGLSIPLGSILHGPGRRACGTTSSQKGRHE